MCFLKSGHMSNSASVISWSVDAEAQWVNWEKPEMTRRNKSKPVIRSVWGMGPIKWSSSVYHWSFPSAWAPWDGTANEISRNFLDSMPNRSFLVLSEWVVLMPIEEVSFCELRSSYTDGKDSDAGRDWGQEEKGTTEDEMAGWHHRLDGREFEWTLGVGDGQGGLTCCNSWGHKESDTTERLNWTELNWYVLWSLPRWLSGEESTSNAGDAGSIPGSRRSPGEGNGNPLQFACLGDPMDRGAWRATVHGVADSATT